MCSAETRGRRSGWSGEEGVVEEVVGDVGVGIIVWVCLGDLVEMKWSGRVESYCELPVGGEADGHSF